jgi:hypothetical protein
LLSDFAVAASEDHLLALLSAVSLSTPRNRHETPQLPDQRAVVPATSSKRWDDLLKRGPRRLAPVIHERSEFVADESV